MEKQLDQKIALCIDCENISPSSIDQILDELSNYGVTYIKNAYGNWKDPRMVSWESRLKDFAIKPIQQFAYTKQKNAVDMAMLIDIMDLMYEGKVDAFALATSDSDFTPVVMRILRNGMIVYGFGEKKTPQAFVNACSRFIYTDKIVAVADSEEEVSKVQIKDSALIQMLHDAIDEICEEDGWANVASLGQYISRRSSFSPKNYGHKRLGTLLSSLRGSFENTFSEDKSVMYVKNK